MRLLDRYMFGVFIFAFAIFLLSFLSLFLVVDFSTRLNRFLTIKDVDLASFMLQYYVVRIPLFLLYVLPTVTLFASMFSFVKLQKTNELVPIVTSGVSLRRLSLPFVAAALATAGGTFLLDEFALPRLMPMIGETDEVLVSNATSTNVIGYDLQRNYLRAQQYDNIRKIMTDVSLTRSRANNNKHFVVRARLAQWNPERKRWIFSDGAIEYWDEAGNIEKIEEPGMPPRVRRDQFGTDGWTLEPSSIVPADLQRRLPISGDFAALKELRRKVREYPHVPSFQVAVHNKFSFPLSCVVLVLLGLPFVVAPHGKSFIRGLTLCFFVTGAYYILHFSLVDRGNAGKIDPAMASWGATVVGTLVGSVLFLRMKS